MNYPVTSSQQRSFSSDHLAICIRLFAYNANCVWKRYIRTLSFIASIEDNSSRKRWGIYFCRSGHAPLSCAIRIIKDILTFSARRLPSAAIKFFGVFITPNWLQHLNAKKKKWKNVEACKRKPMVLKRCLRSNLISFLKKDFRHLN